MPQTDINKTIKEISRDELMQLLAVDANVKLVDVTDNVSYEKEHIKGAISLPLKELHEQAKKRLKKDETVVVYCVNLKCAANAVTAAETLLSLGYKNILYYKGGLDDYKKANLPLEGSLYITK